jgi:hypothetical protein
MRGCVIAKINVPLYKQSSDVIRRKTERNKVARLKNLFYLFFGQKTTLFEL